MLKTTPKYRAFLFYILLISYVSSSFPFPFYEAVHFFAHLEETVHSDYSFHSYHQHDHSHQHITLNMLDQSKEDQKGDHFPKEFKKKVETTKALHWSSLKTFEYRIDNFKTTFPFTGSFLEQIYPPPEQV